jgi:hypothetical protein
VALGDQRPGRFAVKARELQAGLEGLLEGLKWIQREAATGFVETADERGGRLVFKNGLLLSAEPPTGLKGEDGAELPEDLHRLAQLILSSWCRAEIPLVFDDGGTPGPLGGEAGRVNVGDLILDMVRQNADPGWVRRHIGAGSAKVTTPDSLPTVLPRVALTPTEAFLMSRADGSLSFQEILSVSPMDPDEVSRALYGLLAVGLLELPQASMPEEKTPAPPEPAEKAAPEVMPVNALDAFLERTSDLPAPSGEPSGAKDAPARSAPSNESTGYARSIDAENERAAVLERIQAARNTDHYGILDVDRSADEEGIRRAYYRIARRFHPDRFRRPEFEEIIDDVEQMFSATTEAYNTLSHQNLRAEYERDLAASASSGRGAEVNVSVQARESYLRARKHVEAEEFHDAVALLEMATRLDGSKAEYWLLLGTIQAKNPRWRKKAEESYLKTAELDPTSADAYLHLGRLYRAGGLSRRALEMYKNVLQWDPDNEEAQEVTGGKSGEKAAGVTGRLRSIFKGS